MAPLPEVSIEQLQRVHQALHISVPLEQASPLLLSTLATIAHCWRGRIPEHLFPGPTPRTRHVASLRPTVDLKRRAAGDLDEA